MAAPSLLPRLTDIVDAVERIRETLADMPRVGGGFVESAGLRLMRIIDRLRSPQAPAPPCGVSTWSETVLRGRGYSLPHRTAPS